MDGQSSRPDPGPLPGTWPTHSFAEEYLHPHDAQGREIAADSGNSTQAVPGSHHSLPEASSSSVSKPAQTVIPSAVTPETRRSSDRTAVPSREDSQDRSEAAVGAIDATTSDSSPSEEGPHTEERRFESIKSGDKQPSRPKPSSKMSQQPTEDDIFRALSRRRTNQSAVREGSYAASAEDDQEQEEIQRLMSRMFGESRKAQSEDEKTRHVGVVFKNLTVKGVGLGAALQPTLTDPFMAPYRLIKGLLSHPRQAAGKPPVRTLLNNFSGCIRPGEMLLVLGRPG